MGASRLHHRPRPRGDHALAVAAVSRPVGIELGLDEDGLEDLESAALLHDLGKIAAKPARQG